MRKHIQRLVGGIALCGLGLAVPGCTPESYRRDADRQVNSILHDRKYNTIGYNPQTEAGAAPVQGIYDVPPELREKVPTVRDSGPAVVGGPGQPPIPARAYAEIPVTRLPAIEPVALELPREEVPYGPLGPWPETSTSPSSGPTTSSATQPADAAAQGGNLGEPRFQSMEERVVFGRPEERVGYGPPSPFHKSLVLGLFESLQFGVEHSRAYRSQMDNVYLSALDVTLQRHLFEPTPFTTLGLNYTGSQKDNAYKSALTATLDAGVRQRLPYGGEIVAEGLVNFVNTVSGNIADGESAQLALSGSIPLLRGAGMVNLEPLVLSERTLVYRLRDFEDYRRQFAVDVATQFFTVLTSLQSVNNRRLNVDNLTDLLYRTRALYYDAPVGLKGRLSFLEVQRAEQSLLAGQNDLITAQATYLNNLDDFKIILGMDIRQDLQVEPVALDVTIPDIETRDVVALATQYRLDLQTARDQVDDARRQVAVGQNGLLPDLSLTAQGALGNRTSTPGRELDSRNLTYSAGLTLDLPIDRLAERNIYRQKLIALSAAQRSAGDLQDRIAADVRSAVRAIRLAQSSVAIQRRSIELAQRRLENANAQLKNPLPGMSISSRDVVEAQQSLLTAQDQYEQAQANLQVQVLQFLKLTGLLRVDPSAGTLGRAMDRNLAIPVGREGLGPVPTTEPPTPLPQ